MGIWGSGMANKVLRSEAFKLRRGESGKSFEWLERAYEQRDPGMPLIKKGAAYTVRAWI